MNLEEFRRFPMFEPGAFTVSLLTWGTLVVEFACGILIWFRDLRYWVLLAGLGLHLGIEYSMNVPLFQWIILATYVTFIYPEDLARARVWVSERLAARFGQPVDVVYDGGSERATRAARVLSALDIFGRLRIRDLRSPDARQAWPELASTARSRVLIATPLGWRAGLGGLRFVAPMVPLLWPLAPASFFGAQKHAARAAFAEK
jgi:hypothetical protein